PGWRGGATWRPARRTTRRRGRAPARPGCSTRRRSRRRAPTPRRPARRSGTPSRTPPPGWRVRSRTGWPRANRRLLARGRMLASILMRNFVLLGLVCVWACGAGGGTTSPDAPPNGNTCVPGSPFNLDGRMGVEGTLNVHINASGIVDTEATADLLLLLDVDETGTNLAVQATLCDLQIPA